MSKSSKETLQQELAKLREENIKLHTAYDNILKSEESYRNIFNSTFDAILIQDIHTKKILEINDTFTKMFGYSMENAKKLTFSSLSSEIPPYTKEEAHSLIESTISGQPQSFDWQLKKKNGSCLWVHIVLKTIIIDGINRIITIIKDINLQKKGEMALNNSELCFRTLSEATSDALIISENGYCIEANDAAIEILGYSYDEIIGIPINNIIAPGSKELVRKKMNSGYEKPYEITTIRKDGTTFQAEMRDKSFSFKGKKARITSLHDISKLKTNELAMIIQQKQFYQLVEFLPLGIIIYSLLGKVIYVNKTAIKIFKAESSDEIIGANVLDSLPESEKEIVDRRFKQLLKGKDAPKIEEKMLDFDGNLVDLEVVSQKVNFQNETAIMTVFSDITKRKQTEKTLKESEESYRNFFIHSPDPIVIIAGGKILSYNKAARDFIQDETSNSYIGKSFSNFIHPDYYQTAGKLLEAINNGMQPELMIKLVFITKKGNIRNVEVGAVSTYFKGKKAIQVVWRDITTRVQTYNKLKTSEETYRELFNNATNAIYIQNKNREFIDVNQGVINMYGYRKDYYIGKTPVFLSAPLKNDFNKINEHFNLAFDGIPQQFEFWGKRKSGEIFPKIVHLYKTKYFGEDVIYAFAVDISEMKQAQVKIKESEERFRALFNHATDSIIIVDPNYPKGEPVILDVNEAAFKALGYVKEELIGLQVKQITDKKTFELAQSRFKKLKVGTPLTFEANRIRKDGSSFPVEVSSRIIILGNKKLIYLIERDITERKKVETELTRLAALIQQTEAITIVTDLEGNMEYVNPAFLTTTQYNRQEVLGKKTNILKSGKHSNSFYTNLWNTITNGDIWHDILINKKKDDSLYYEDAIIFPVKDKDNSIINYAAIGRDITQEYKLKQQLQQAQKMETVGTLSGGIAHDFNNLLTVINGHAEIALLNTSKNSKVYNDLLSIIKAGKRAEKVTNQLLAFSRKQIHETAILKINKIINDLGKMLRHLIPTDISIEYSLSPNLPNIKADPSQVEQILINLVINAKDAIDENRKSKIRRINIKTEPFQIDKSFINSHPGSKEGKYILISVGDSGTGIDEKIKERVFEPFFTTKEIGKGTGLGLSMVYGIIKQNDGFIYIENNSTIGTIFNIYWPTTSKKLSSSTTGSSKNESMAGNETILLVEDDADVRELVSMALKNFGYSVIETENGLKALELQNLHNIDIMITDIIMPGINGKDLALQLKEKIPLNKVLFVSGYSQDHLLSDGSLQEGINFLQKPYPIDKLLMKVREILDTPE